MMQILCTTDFSQAAMDTADVAAAIAEKWNLPLRLIYCEEDWAAMGGVSVGSPDESSARRRLNAEVQRLRATGLTVHGEIRIGNSVLVLVEAAKEIPTKLLVVGPIEKTLLPISVAASAAHDAPIPILIVQHASPLLKWLREAVQLRLLCGVDFTLSADAAIAYLPQLKTLGEIDISVGYIAAADHPSAEPEAREMLESQLWEKLRKILGETPQLAETPVAIYVRGTANQPPEEFIDLAKDLDANLLLVGAHQYRGLKRLLKGSFSQAALHLAKTNVLCVPVSSYQPPAISPAIHRVLVATDFSECGNSAILYALGLVHAGDAVRLVHILASSVPIDKAADPSAQDSITQAEAKLQALVPRTLATAHLDTSCEAVADRDVGSAIRDAADRFRADVVCIGARGHTRARIALLGSTVQSILAHSTIPVFVVTSPAQ